MTALGALVIVAALIYAVPRPEREKTPVSSVAAEPVDAVQAFLSEREEVRKLETLRLSAVAADEAADEAVREEARRELIRLAGFMEAETTIEGVLRLRGFADAVATVHTDSVNILVRASGLTQSQSAQILDLVMRETGQRGGNIKIMTVD